MSKSLERGLTLLFILHAKGPLGLSQICREAGLPKATSYRLLTTLRELRFVDQESNGHYRLGIALVGLGQAVLDKLELRKVARAFLEKLRDDVAETVHLGVLDGNSVVYLDKLPGPHLMQMSSRIGHLVPANAGALGKVLLAGLSEDELHKVVNSLTFAKSAPNTIVDPALLISHIAEVRHRQYAIDNEETESGVRCVGAAIFNHSGSVVAAVSISGPSIRIPLDHIPHLARQVMHVADSISGALGYSGPRTVKSMQQEPFQKREHEERDEKAVRNFVL